MKLPTWSLRALCATILAVAFSLAALLNPTDEIAIAAGIALALALVATIAIAIGTRGAARSACAAFVVTCGLVLYLNDMERKLFTDLPSTSEPMANWLNDRFGWAEWKGPPRTFVYWSADGRVHYISFDSRGDFRSGGSLDWREAERDLRGKIALDNLPTEFPLRRPNLSALRNIIGVVSAFWVGIMAGWLAHIASATPNVPRR